MHRRNTPCGVGEVLDFLGLEWTVENGAFAVGKPFLEDLVTAEFVGPDGGGDVAPEGAVVQVHVEGGFTERGEAVAHRCLFIRCVGAFDDPALAWHDGIACSEVSPTSRHRKIVSGHVPAVGGGRYADRGDLRTQRALGNAWHKRVGVEQPGQLAASRGRCNKSLSRAVGLAIRPSR